MKNEGKKFEEDFKKSIPEGCWCYRLRDSSGAWTNLGNGENTRFTPSNICDFMVMKSDILFLLELKSIKGASISFSCIRDNQVKELSSIDHPNIKAMFVINFREREKSYAIQAKKVKEFIDNSDRKSIPISWCQQNGIEIEGVKKKVRFRYKIESLFRGAENEQS